MRTYQSKASVSKSARRDVAKSSVKELMLLARLKGQIL